MEKKYLCQIRVDIKDTPYAKFNKLDWAMYFVERYGGFEAAYHKAWVLDQVARVGKGTPIVIESASWSDGEQEYRIWLGEPSKKYIKWVNQMKGKYIKTDDYEGFEYDYDVGRAP